MLTLVAATSADLKSEKDSVNIKFLDACSMPGNHENIKAALNEGAYINTRDQSSGQTCLMLSSLLGFIDNVKLMFELGADWTIGEKDGYTPPHGAAFQGRSDVMQFLSDSGLDVNEFHKDGYAPIHR